MKRPYGNPRFEPWRDAVFDAVVVVTTLLIGLGLAPASGSPLKPFGGATAVLLGAVALPLFWRRRAPLAVAWIVAGTAVLVPVAELVAEGSVMRAGESVDFETMLMWTPAAPFAAFAAMAFAGDRRARWLPVAGMLLGALLMGWALPLGPGISAAEEENAGPTGEVAFRSLMLIVVGMLLGMYGAARKRVLRALTERADRAERERYMLAEQARAEERARLAAEMHDVVTHRVSLMVLQAGALRVTSQDESVHAAAEALRATGCQALEELRDVVGLLRRDDGADADAGAAPGAPDAAGDGGGTGERASVPGLSELIAESESVGVAAELTEEGDPPLASPVIGRTAYRIVQEALTNVRKHAPGARVEVRVRYRPDGVRLSVRNSATDRPADSLLSAVGSGMGLTGLRQRVELIGGTLTAGPDGGGFHVQAELPAYVPTTAAPAEPAPLRA